jgi:hypothetical protein
VKADWEVNGHQCARQRVKRVDRATAADAEVVRAPTAVAQSVTWSRAGNSERRVAAELME